MRVAVLSTDPGVPWGGTKGASVHLRRVVDALAFQGAEVFVFAAAKAPDVHKRSGIQFRELPGPAKGASVEERLAAEPHRTAWLIRRLELWDADVLYERFALHSAAGSAAAQILGIPHLVELNAPLREEAARYRMLEYPGAARQIERLVLSRANLVLPVSDVLAQYARRHGARQTMVVPNAAAVDGFALPARDHAKPPVAVIAGTLKPWHGVDTVATAWRLLGSTAPELLVVGDGAGRTDLEAVGAWFTGSLAHDGVAALLAACDIGLVPYARDAPRYFSPLKLFEYLAAGLAVVAADVPGVTNIVNHEVAVLVPPGDAEALAHAVARLVADRRSRDRMGAAGRALVASRHTWAHRASAILAAASNARAGLVRAP